MGPAQGNNNKMIFALGMQFLFQNFDHQLATYSISLGATLVGCTIRL